jgi:hypothetical protein
MKVGQLTTLLEELDADDEAHIVIGNAQTQQRLEIEELYEDDDGCFNIITQERSAGPLAPDTIEHLTAQTSDNHAL